MIPGFEDLVNKYAVYAVDAPCDCEELFGITDCGRSSEVWSAIPIEDVEEMIEEASALHLGRADD